jgi:predicted RNA binding protein YcfA (HicA-like mRNA interferase family)
VAKQEKQLAKLRQNAKNVSPDQLDSLLLGFGFRELSQSGSHRKYVHSLFDGHVVVALRRPLDIGAVKATIRAIDEVLEKEEGR